MHEYLMFKVTRTLQPKNKNVSITRPTLYNNQAASQYMEENIKKIKIEK